MDPLFYNNIFTIPKHALEAAVKGGIIIAAASSIYYMLFGGILGMSGMAGSVVKFPTRHSTKLKAIVILGILFASALIHFFVSRFSEFKAVMHLPFDDKSTVDSTPVTHLALAGMLVGFGTDLANGCTSGHGLCGMPRFSVRSFVAVLAFLSTAIATATFSIKSYIPDFHALKYPILNSFSVPSQYYLGFCLAAVLSLMFLEKEKSFLAKFSLFLIGIVFGCGLMVAGMSQRSKIYGFLELNSSWDPSLLFVLMTGVIINVITFNFIIKFIQKPSYGDKIQNPQGKVTKKLIIGSILFGIGWGIGGLCPGPFILSVPNSIKIAIAWGVPFFASQKISNAFFSDHHHHHEHHHKQSEQSHEALKEKSS